MGGSILDRLGGTSTSVAVKAPVVVATTGQNIALTGLIVLDGTQLNNGDRVLVKDQTLPIQNGIYNASITGWTRAADFNGSRDAVTGTLVYVTAGMTLFDSYYRVTTANPIQPGVSNVTFTQAFLTGSVLNQAQSYVAAALVQAQNAAASATQAYNYGQTVLGNTALGLVAANISSLNSVGANIANVNTVANAASNISQIISNLANVNSVGGSIANVNTVAAIAAAISTVAQNNTALSTVNGSITAVQTVAAGLGAGNPVTVVAAALGAGQPVTVVAGKIADVSSVAGKLADVSNVAARGADVSAVAADIINLHALASDLTNVNAVAADLPNVDSVAQGLGAINTVNANASNVNAVAGSIGNVNTVAGIQSSVTAVAGDTGNINAVAANLTGVNTVAGSIANVNTVANNTTALTTVANNMPSVVAAANNIPKANLSATRNPLVSDDTSAGYRAGSEWANTSANTLWFCTNAAAGAAVWIQVGGAASTSFADSAFRLINASDNSKAVGFDVSSVPTNTLVTLQSPSASTRLIGRDTTDVLTNKTFDTAGIGNVLKIAGVQVTAVSGTGANVLAQQPTIVQPTIAQILNGGTITLPANVTDQLVGRNTTDTLANKTLTAPQINNGTVNGATVTGLPTPTTLTDAATKGYVDSLVAGLAPKGAVRAATIGNLTGTYANGSSGVGATLTNSGTQAALVVDGVTLNTGDVLLLRAQTTAAQNGLYTVTATGSGSSNWVLTRATNFDESSEIKEGSYVVVDEGTAMYGTLFILTTQGTVTVGTTSLSFTELVVAPQTVNLANSVTGTLAATNGGTGQASYAVGDLLAANTTTSLQRLATSSTSGLALLSGGTGVVPAYGVLGAAGGGTGQSTTAVGDLLFASAAGSWSRLAASTNGYILSLVGGVPAWTAPSVPSVVQIAAGASSFTAPFTPTSTSQFVVVLGGVPQNPNTLSFSGTTVSLGGTAPAAGWAFCSQGTTFSIGTPSDGTVTNAKLTANAVALTNMQPGSVNFATHTSDSIATNAQAIAGTAANVLMTPAAQAARENNNIIEQAFPSSGTSFNIALPTSVDEWDLEIENWQLSTSATFAVKLDNSATGNTPLTTNTACEINAYTGTTFQGGSGSGGGMLTLSLNTGGIGLLRGTFTNRTNATRNLELRGSYFLTSGLASAIVVGYDSNTGAGVRANFLNISISAGAFNGTGFIRLRPVKRNL